MTGNFPKALLPGVKSWFGRTYDEHKAQYTDLFDVETSDKAYEEDVQVTGFGLATVKTQGGGVTYDDEMQGYVQRYTHVVYGLGFMVTQEELEDSQYEVVSKRRSQALAFSMRQTKEVVAANVYNRHSTAGYNGGDGVVMLSTAHPSSAGNWSNILSPAADLSEAALEDLVNMIHTATNDKGLRISLIPQSLIIPPQLWFEANRILKSTLQSGSAQNDINVLKATGAFPKGIIMNSYLTDQDAFFVRSNAPRGMVMFQRRALAVTTDNDFDTENAKFKATERYSMGWTDPRQIWGSAGL